MKKPSGKSQNANQPLTLRGLAEYTQEVLLPAIDQRFQKVDARFQKVDEQFQKVDARFQKVDEQFQKVDARFQKVDERSQSVDEQFQSVDKRFRQIDLELSDIKSQMATKDDLDALRNDVLTALDQNTALLQKVSDEQSAISFTLARHDSALAGHEQRIVRLEKKTGAR